MSYVADPDRYDGKMRYRRTGRSGLDLPVLSLGYWHNFGDDRPFEVQREIARRAFDLGITHHDLANNYGPPYGAAEINFGRLMRRGLPPLPRRDGDLDQGRLGHVAGPVRTGRRLAQVPARLARPVAASGWASTTSTSSTRHRLDATTPLEETMGALDTAVRAGQGALRRHLLLRRRAHARGGGDPARARHPAADPPAVLLDAEPLDRDRGPARRRRRAGNRRDRIHRARAGAAHRPLPRRRPRGLARRGAGHDLRHRLAHRRDDRAPAGAQRDRGPPRPDALRSSRSPGRCGTSGSPHW